MQRRNYGNWELSADRANAARRLMQGNGVGADQVKQVRGFADQRLRNTADPLDPSNRRISVIVQYMPKTGDDEDAKPAGGEAKPEDKSEGASEEKPQEKSGTKPEAAGAKPSAGSAEKK